jgi:hypothetical protein
MQFEKNKAFLKSSRRVHHVFLNELDRVGIVCLLCDVNHARGEFPSGLCLLKFQFAGFEACWEI